MGKSITHEVFINKVLEKNEHVKSGKIDIIGRYKGVKTPIECKCNIHNIELHITPNNLYRGSGCFVCEREKISNKQKKPLEVFINELNKLNNGVKIEGEYINNRTPINFRCAYGHIWTSTPSNILKGSGCPYCSNKKVLINYNDLWTTRPDVAQLLTDPEDGYKYTYGSKKQVSFTCPHCKSISNKVIQDVCARGFHCNKCSDNISYPNKLSRVMLDMLDVKNVSYEWQPDWLKPYFYDNYFEYNGKRYVLEMDGGIAHGNKIYGTNETDIDGLQRDIKKDKLARLHGIYVIRIDCYYSQREDRLEYIKKNILNSKLTNILDLSLVDWELCDKYALSSLVVESASLYNKGYAIGEISKQLGYHNTTIVRWLKQATSVNLCAYDKNETQKRGRMLVGRNVNQYTLDGKFVASYSALIEAERITHINSRYIYRCCVKVRKSTGGFMWFYADDLNQPDKTKIFTFNSTKLIK